MLQGSWEQKREKGQKNVGRFDIKAVVRGLWIDGGTVWQHVQAPDAMRELWQIHG